MSCLYPATVSNRATSKFQVKLKADQRKRLIPLPWEYVNSKFVSWCFESSPPQRITSGLKTNFKLSPAYSFHKSLYQKSPFLKPQLKFYPQFRNEKPEKQNTFWSLFIIFREHLTRKLASSRVTYFILRAYTGTSIRHSQHRKNSGEVWQKCR